MSKTESLETKLVERDIIEMIEAISRNDLEGKTQTTGINGDEFIRDFMAEAKDNSFRTLVQKFKDKDTGKIYEAAMTEHGLKCDCEEWNSRRCCKHIVYVFDKLSVRDEHGRIVGIACKVTEMPTYEEAKEMDFGSNEAETEEWQIQHIAEIEL